MTDPVDVVQVRALLAAATPGTWDSTNDGLAAYQALLSSLGIDGQRWSWLYEWQDEQTPASAVAAVLAVAEARS